MYHKFYVELIKKYANVSSGQEPVCFSDIDHEKKYRIVPKLENSSNFSVYKIREAFFLGNEFTLDFVKEFCHTTEKLIDKESKTILSKTVNTLSYMSESKKHINISENESGGIYMLSEVNRKRYLVEVEVYEA